MPGESDVETFESLRIIGKYALEDSRSAVIGFSHQYLFLYRKGLDEKFFGYHSNRDRDTESQRTHPIDDA